MLYGDDAISEKDYLIERKRITDDIANIDARIDELEKDRASQVSMSDADLLEQASFFIVSQSLADRREVDYEKIVRTIDPKIVKDFLGSVVHNFCIKDGKVDAIRFKNGMEHRFLYGGES